MTNIHTTVYVLALLVTAHGCSWDGILPCACLGSSCDVVAINNLTEYISSQGDCDCTLYSLGIVNLQELSTLTVGTFGSIKYSRLYIKNTGLSSIDDNAFQGTKDVLEDIHIDGHQIINFNFKSLENLNELKSLHVSGGHITEIPADAFPSNSGLEYINFQDNRITTIHNETFNSLSKVRWINLSFNKISAVGENVFTMPNIVNKVTIHLDWNQIKEIHKYAFRDLKFQTLGLAGNQLETLDQNVFELLLEYLTYFRVKDGLIRTEGNPFRCDSSILWLVKKPFWHKSCVAGFVCKESRLTIQQLREEDISISPV